MWNAFWAQVKMRRIELQTETAACPQRVMGAEISKCEVAIDNFLGLLWFLMWRLRGYGFPWQNFG
jgi:hypothetical protein